MSPINLGRGKRIHTQRLVRGGELVVFHSLDESTVWESATGKRLAAFRGPSSSSKAWDGLLIAMRPKGVCELVDATTGETRLVMEGAGLGDVLGASGRAQLIALGSPHDLFVWDVARNRLARQLWTLPLRPTAAAFSPDGRILAVGDVNAVIRLWDMGTLEPHGMALLGHSQVIQHLAFSPNCGTLVSVGADETVRLWDVTTGEELLTLRWPIGVVLSRPRFAPDGRTLAFCAQDGYGTWLYLLPTAPPGGLESEGAHESGRRAQAFRPDADGFGPVPSGSG